MGRKQIHGLGPNMGLITEAERKDERYGGKEMDSLLNHIMLNGDSDESIFHWAQKWKRSFKASKRQWELYLYIDKDTKALDYHPTKRHWRGELPFTTVDIAVIRYHRKAQVEPALTAALLQRGVEQIENWRPCPPGKDPK